MSSAPVRELGHEATHITPLKPQFRYSHKTTIQSTLWDHVTFSLDRCLWWWIIKMKHWWSLMWVCVGWWSSSERWSVIQCVYANVIMCVLLINVEYDCGLVCSESIASRGRLVRIKWGEFYGKLSRFGLTSRPSPLLRSSTKRPT